MLFGDFSHDVLVSFSYLKRDFNRQSDRFVIVLYVANQTGHNSLWPLSSHHQVKIKAFILLYTQPNEGQIKNRID